MCDWPVYDMYGSYRIDPARMCRNDGIHEMGPLTVCARHYGVLIDGMVDAIRREARDLIAEGRRTPGDTESRLLEFFAALDRERRADQYGPEEPCVYFAERDGCVKIGKTVNLAKRMKELSCGSSGLPGMTVGPVTLLAAIPGGIRKEQAFHMRFAALRVDRTREWFRYEGALRKFVEGLQAGA